MTPRQAQAAALTALAQPPSPAPAFADLGAWAVWNAHNLAAEAVCAAGERAMRAPRRAGRARRFARALAHHPLRTAQTCVRAAKLLPTVRAAVPWYVWPVLGLAAAVKCLPLDMGADEALFALALALIAWRRPGLLDALYREASAGKPARCQCGRHTRKAVAR